MAGRPVYRADGWVLGSCELCGHLNYVEPHGVTAFCPEDATTTVHHPIPYNARIGQGGLMVDTSKVLFRWMLVWSPEGREIGEVLAPTRSKAKKLAPKPYRKYQGELYAKRID